MKIYASVKNPEINGNTGDMVSYILANKYSNQKIIKLGVDDKAQIDASTACFVGSVLQWLPPARGMSIYGCGYIDDKPCSQNLKKNNLLGVRGYYSWEKIFKSYKKSVQITSDPGLLVSETNPISQDVIKSHDIGFVIHSADRKIFFEKFPNLRSLMIDNYGNFDKYLKDLSKYRCIATTSLHGAVFCHSFGINVGVFSCSGGVMGGDFKYKDYYSSLGVDFSMTNWSIIGDCKEDYIDFINSQFQPNQQHIIQIKRKIEVDISNILSSL